MAYQREVIMPLDKEFIIRGQKEKTKTEFDVTITYGYYESEGHSRFAVKIRQADLEKFIRLHSSIVAACGRVRFKAIMTKENLLVLTPSIEGYAMHNNLIQFSTVSQLRIAEYPKDVRGRIDAVMRWNANGSWVIAIPKHAATYDDNGNTGERLRDSAGRGLSQPAVTEDCGTALTAAIVNVTVVDKSTDSYKLVTEPAKCDIGGPLTVNDPVQLELPGFELSKPEPSIPYPIKLSSDKICTDEILRTYTAKILASAKLLAKLDSSHFHFPATKTAFNRFIHILRTKSEHMDWVK
jgi:hypothetical protein